MARRHELAEPHDADRPYYCESGIVPFHAVPAMGGVAFAIALASSPLLAVLGSLLLLVSAFDPFGLTFGVLLLLPYFHSKVMHRAIKYTAKACEVRNRRIVDVVEVLAICLAFACVYHSLLWLYTGAGRHRFYELLNPITLCSTTVETFGATHWLVLIAAVALGLVVLFIYLLPWLVPEDNLDAPYCEWCGCFTICHPATVNFKFLTTTAFENQDFEAFRPFTPNSATTQFFFAKMHACPRCEDSCYLRIWQVDRWPQFGKEDKNTDRTRLVVDLLKVPLDVKRHFESQGKKRSRSP